MINIIGWVIFGALAGWLGRFFYPGAIEMNLIMTILLGIGGSFVGGFIGSLFHRGTEWSKPKPAGFVMSIIGAMVLIFIAHRLGIR